MCQILCDLPDKESVYCGKGEKWELGKALKGFIFSLQPFSSSLWQL
jgi:hypothetical protein